MNLGKIALQIVLLPIYLFGSLPEQSAADPSSTSNNPIVANPTTSIGETIKKQEQSVYSFANSVKVPDKSDSICKLGKSKSLQIEEKVNNIRDFCNELGITDGNLFHTISRGELTLARLARNEDFDSIIENPRFFPSAYYWLAITTTLRRAETSKSLSAAGRSFKLNGI